VIINKNGFPIKNKDEPNYFDELVLSQNAQLVPMLILEIDKNNIPSLVKEYARGGGKKTKTETKEPKISDVVVEIPKIVDEEEALIVHDPQSTVTKKSKSPQISEKFSQKDPEKDPQYEDSFSEEFTQNRSTSEYYPENLGVVPRTKAIVEHQPSSGELGSSSSFQNEEEESERQTQITNIRPRITELEDIV